MVFSCVDGGAQGREVGCTVLLPLLDLENPHGHWSQPGGDGCCPAGPAGLPPLAGNPSPLALSRLPGPATCTPVASPGRDSPSALASGCRQPSLEWHRCRPMPPHCPSHLRKAEGLRSAPAPETCQLSALKTGEPQPSPASKAPHGLLRGFRPPGLRWPTPPLAPPQTLPQLLSRAQTGSEQEMKTEEGQGGGPPSGKEGQSREEKEAPGQGRSRGGRAAALEVKEGRWGVASWQSPSASRFDLGQTKRG